MSGGVDSSVATALLLDQGYSVTGVTMKLFDNDILPDGTESTCCSLDDVEDAKDVCRRLGIPHLTLNFKDRFASKVMNQFCQAYLSGTTPNPCIECNRHLKFAGLQQRRRELGAEYVATGHYVRRRYNPETQAWELLKARDDHKDQSYVLYHLTQNDLAHMLFPLGDLTKSEVRALADARGFINARKRESQDICFVPDGDHVGFIERYQLEGEHAGNNPIVCDPSQPPFAPGDIVDQDGNLLGQHHGLIHYTTGQRKGIGLASSSPLYVWEKDMDRNQLVVAHHEDLLVDEIHLSDVNLIAGKDITPPQRVQVKTNYNQKPIEAELFIEKDMDSENGASGLAATVHFLEPQVRPAPGQSAVAYEGDLVLGGGIIV